MTQMKTLATDHQSYHKTKEVMISAGGNDLRSKDLHKMLTADDKDTFLRNMA